MSPAIGASPVGQTNVPPPPPLPSTMSITLKTSDGRHTLTGLIGQNEPRVTDGRGGWQEVARTRKPAVIEWLGPASHKATIEILLDAWASGGTIDSQLAIVEAIAPLSPTVETPTVYVVGWPLIPSTIPWVVQTAIPSDALRRRDGRMARVTMTFDLLQWRQGDVVVRNSPGKAAASKAGTSASKPRTVVVRKGDTLGALAARYLGSASKWTVLAKLNNIRSPNNLKVGTTIKLS